MEEKELDKLGQKLHDLDEYSKLNILSHMFDYVLVRDMETEAQMRAEPHENGVMLIFNDALDYSNAIVTKDEFSKWYVIEEAH